MKIYVVSEREQEFSYMVISVFSNFEEAVKSLESMPGITLSRWGFVSGMSINNVIRDGKQYTYVIVEKELQ